MISKKMINYAYNINSKMNYSNLNNITKKRLDFYLRDNNYLEQEDIILFWEKYLNLTSNKDTFNHIRKNTIDKIGIKWILFNRIIPYDETSNKVKVFTDDINDYDKILNIEKIYNKKSEIILRTKDEMDQMLDILNADLKLNDNVENVKINKLVNSFIEYAIDNMASDVHFEYQKEHVGVRFRIDGVLTEAFQITLDTYNLLLNRIKILSNLDLTINLTPQDGHFTYKYNNIDNDVRISTIPTLYGTRLVLRIFHKSKMDYDLNTLGFDDKQLIDIKSSLLKNGLIVVTGPTGSGKTTTLYSILNYLKNDYKNIMTIEDPIENELENIAQIPLNKMNYSMLLKSIVRQDPDIIMVGEIRDFDTATNAIRLAQTGHLVLATVHSSDGLGVISKLINMNIQKYLLVDSLKLIISQRLIRKPCEKCSFEYDPSGELLDKLELEKHTKFMSTTGCKDCLNTGYKGRIMISEVIKIDENNKDYVFNRNNHKLLFSLNKQIFLKNQIIKKLKNKEVSYDEIIRNGIID